MPTDSTLQHKSVPPCFPEPARRRLLIAMVTLIVALFSFALPASWLGERSGGATSAAARLEAVRRLHRMCSRPHRSGVGTVLRLPRIRLGPRRTGRRPGFDPWPGSPP